MKYWFAVVLVVLCLIATQFRLRSQSNAAAVAAPETFSFRLAFGGQDKQPAKWDGRISGNRIQVEGWRFSAEDSVSAQSWKLQTEETKQGAEPVLGPVTEKGVIVTAAEARPDSRFDVETANGKFSFTAARFRSGPCSRYWTAGPGWSACPRRSL